MTSKSFKSISGNTSLTIEPNDSGVRFYITDLRGNSLAIVTPAESAAGEALAVLEAAGGRDALGIDVGNAMLDLREYVSEQERATAEAKELAELEAEALELRRAWDGLRIERLSDLVTASQEKWLAVARRAREMRAEK